MKTRMMNILLAGSLLAVSVQADQGVNKAVDFRNSAMTLLKWNMSRMGAVIKGKAAYEPEGFARMAADLSAVAHLDLLSGFPEGSDESDDSDARMDIWLQWDDFSAKLNDFRQAAQMLEASAKGGDLQQVVPKYSAVGKACKACHDAYKD